MEKMIYLDNAATSYPKPRAVINEVNRCIRKYCGNPGRSGHSLSIKAAEEIYSSREQIAKHIGISNPENVVFTPNATFALNLAIKTLIPENCHVLCSDYEHNSVIRPLNRLSRDRGVEYSYFCSCDDLSSKINSNTKAIVCSLASNVTGFETDISFLSNIAEKYKLLLILDASQVLGHKRLNLQETPCDALCAPGHKALMGIQGCGFAAFKGITALRTLFILTPYKYRL